MLKLIKECHVCVVAVELQVFTNERSYVIDYWDIYTCMISLYLIKSIVSSVLYDFRILYRRRVPPIVILKHTCCQEQAKSCINVVVVKILFLPMAKLNT